MWAGIAIVGFLVFATVMWRWGRKQHQGPSDTTLTGSGGETNTGFQPPVKK